MGADVAAKLNLKPIARVVGYATAGLEPMLVMMTPVEAVRKLNKKTGWKMDDAELIGTTAGRLERRRDAVPGCACGRGGRWRSEGLRGRPACGAAC